MDRKDVYKLIDDERDYQDKKPGHSKERDSNLTAATWILYMHKHLENAMNQIYEMSEENALEEIRKVTALGVACMENNDTKPRS